MFRCFLIPLLAFILVLGGCAREQTNALTEAPKPITTVNVNAITPADFVASALGLEPDEITGLKFVTAKSGEGQEWTAVAGGRDVCIRKLMNGVWSLQAVNREELREKGKVTLEQAQQIAADVVKRRWNGPFAQAAPTQKRALPMGIFLFAWDEQLTPGVYSGNVATTLISPAGKLLSYSEHHAMRQVPVEQVKVSKEQANTAATQALSARTKAQVKIIGSKLVLSSQHSIDRGPVWYVDADLYSPSASGQSEQSGAEQVLIDGMTGQEINLARLMGENDHVAASH